MNNEHAMHITIICMFMMQNLRFNSCSTYHSVSVLTNYHNEVATILFDLCFFSICLSQYFLPYTNTYHDYHNNDYNYHNNNNNFYDNNYILYK